ILSQMRRPDWPFERAVLAARRRRCPGDGVRVQRPVEVRELLARAVLQGARFGGRGLFPAERGAEAFLVDGEEQQPCLPAVEGVGDAQGLLAGRAVDETLAGERCGPVAAFPPGLLPLGSGDEVI